jgi:hypothetical protein
MGFIILLFAIYLPFAGKQVQSWTTMPLEYSWSWVMSLIWDIFIWGIVVGNLLWYGMRCLRAYNAG